MINDIITNILFLWFIVGLIIYFYINGWLKFNR